MQVATPHNELVDRLLEVGWSLKKIDFKQGFYVASGKNEMTGQEYETKGKTPEMATAALLTYAKRAYQVRRRAARQVVAAWDSDWLDQKHDIAQAYAKLPAFDEKAVPAWKALAAESKAQADAIRSQIKVEISDDPEPYMTAQEMCNDVHKNRHFFVSRANAQHPLWSEEDNINFRIVHDVLGHCQSGGDFSWRGENLACGAHFPLVSPLAREALFTECIGQTGYRSAFKGFGPQKVGLLSEFLHPVQERNGEHIFVPHGGMPQLQQPANENQGKGGLDQAPGVAPNVSGPGQWVMPQQPVQPAPVMAQPSPVMQGYALARTAAKMVSPDRPADPNQFWVPGEQSPAVNPSQDPSTDYIDSVATMRNAAKIDTQWWNEPPERQDQAIMNAFRVAILSPRKHLRWNAAHYQAIMHTDPHTKAVDLWNLLEEAREKHNQGLGFDEGSHLSYKKQLGYLVHELQVNEGLSDVEARKRAKEMIFEKTKEFEQQLSMEADARGWSELKLYNQARKLVDQWMKSEFSPAQGWQPGQLALAKTATDDGWQDSLFPAPVEQAQDDTGFSSPNARYGAFMGGHLDAVAQVGSHIDEIRKLALDDIDEGGRGFIFRNGVMNMNLPGVNPKVCSFVWLLLAPMQSELGIVDTHIARGLRRDINDVNPRDYYKYERMQRALKDSTGYGHMPLGMYHWGMWDMIRNPGEHSDHSPLRILDPQPWDDPNIIWDAATSARGGQDYAGPVSFERGRGAAERAAQEFDGEFAGQPPHQVPLVHLPGQAPQEVSPYAIPAISMVRPIRV